MARIATVLALILLLAVSQGNASRSGHLHAQGVIDNRVGSTALSGTLYITGLDTMGAKYVAVDYIRDDVLIFNNDWTLDRYFSLSAANTTPVGLAYDATYIHVLDASGGHRRIYSYNPSSGTPASTASFPVSGNGQGIDWAGSHFRMPTGNGLMLFYDAVGAAATTEQFTLLSTDIPMGATSDGTYQYVLYASRVDVYESGTYHAALGFALGEGCVGNGITYDGTHLQVVCSNIGTSRVETYSPITVPGTVTVTLGTFTPTSMTFSWTEPTAVAPVTDYDIRYSTTSSGLSTTDWPHGGNVRRATITGLSNSSTYYVWVRAVNFVGDGSWGSSVSGSTLTPVVTPTPDPNVIPRFVTTQVAVDGGGFTTQAPTNLAFYTTTDDGPNVSATLTWKSVDYANSYQLELLVEGTTYYYISNNVRAAYSLLLEAPPPGQSTFAAFRTRARLTTAASPDPIREGNRVIILPANATLWGPWSEPHRTPYGRGGGLTSILDTETTPSEVGGTHPGLIELVGAGTDLIGMSPSLNGLLAALGWIVASLMIGALWLRPET